MKSSRTLGVASLLLLLACSRQSAPAATDAAPPPSASLSSNATPAPAKLVPPNLLDVVPAVVAVSSTVVNPHDFPEHLVDGKANTAWNSRTGDLHGFIAFRVPKDAHVERIELTSGFDKKQGALDLFTANHRITKVAVSRDGKKILEAVLDPAQRGPQRISVDKDGGDFRIDVLETLPGSRADWKELTVSELKVVGTPGKDRRSVGSPLRVVAGSLDAEPADIPFEAALKEEHPEPTLAAVCAAYPKRVADAESMEVDAPRRTPTCIEVPVNFKTALKEPYKSVHVVKTTHPYQGIGLELVAETARGFWHMPFRYGVREDTTDPGCPSIVRPELVEEVRVDNGYLVVTYGGVMGTFTEPLTSPEDSGYRNALVRGAYWGKEDTNAFTFWHWNPQYQGPLGEKTQTVADSEKQTPWEALPWVAPRPFHIDPTGLLRIQG